MNKKLIIDLFAGGGGASVGIEMALGKQVDIAINHDPNAILMHETNHPRTKHYCENIWDVNPKEVVNGREVGLMWASPDCTHFSKAKGGKPKDKNIRSLPWVIVRWAKEVRPDVICAENVEEIQTWGPLDKDGYPIKDKKGNDFIRFITSLRNLGYVVEWKELIAADYGASTTRKRWYMIARCDGNKINWPTRTHAKRGTSDVEVLKLKQWNSVADCLDLNDTGKSIFDRKKPLADNTLKRIARGLKKFVVDDPNPFILVNNTGHPGGSIKDPLHTITTGNHHYLISPYIVPIGYGERNGQTPRVNDIKSPLGTVVSTNKHYLVTPYIMQIGHTGFSKDRNKSIKDPLTTVVSKNEHCLISSYLIQYHSEQSLNEVRGNKVDEPIMTIDSSPRYGLVMAFIHKYYDGYYTGAGSSLNDPISTITSIDHNSLCMVQLEESKAQEIISKCEKVSQFIIEYYGQGTTASINDPLHTIVSKDRFALITIHGVEYVIVDISLRMLKPSELFKASSFPEDYIIDRDYTGKPYPTKEQVARCGNAVVPIMAKVLVESNCQHLKEGERIPKMRVVSDSEGRLRLV